MSMKRLTALILSLMIIIGALSSCDFGVKDLQSDTYVVNVRVRFATNDDKMKAAVDAMNSTAVLSVDHGNIQMEAVSAINDVSVKNSYVYIGGIIYHSNQTSVGDMSVAEYERAAASDVEIDSILSKAGAGASIDVIDFNVQERDGKNENYIYNCSRITSKAKESLCNIISSKFEGLDATVILTEASYSLETEGDRSVSSVLSCNFEITMNGSTYEITVHTYCDYDYDAEVNISAPSDSEKYAYVSIEDIIG